MKRLVFFFFFFFFLIFKNLIEAFFKGIILKTGINGK